MTKKPTARVTTAQAHREPIAAIQAAIQNARGGTSPTDEEWEALSDSERAARIRNGGVKISQILKGLTSRSKELRAACAERDGMFRPVFSKKLIEALHAGFIQIILATLPDLSVDEQGGWETISWAIGEARPDIETEHGNVHCTFNFKTVVADFFKEFEERVDFTEFKQTNGKVARFTVVSESDRENVLLYLVQYAAVFMLRELDAEIKEAFYRSFKRATVFAETRVMSLAINDALAANLVEDDFEIDLRETISALQKTLAKERESDKRLIKALAELDHVKLATSKGRPRTWTKEGLDQAVRKASIKFKKAKYRSPTLSDVAASISKQYPDRMPLNAKALGQMLKRYKLEWKKLKNPQI
ncbi:MAG: hypothetical protein M3430_21890 [Acidobacteriota bacterium]|nr:hypothetical protein [Acidobacteriota bacterium]